MNRAWLESLAEFRPVRFAATVALLARGAAYMLAGKLYRGTDDLCRVVRVANPGVVRECARRLVFRTIRSIYRQTPNSLARSYHADPASKACAEVFSISGVGSADLFRDLIVLKRATHDEKGVILLKYARTFSAVVALLDLPRLMSRYTFVLEPCWAGYCDPSILMFIAPGNPVLVQCFTEEDFEYIASIGAPLVPLRLGPADWVNADVFAQPRIVEKSHDLVMVANWGAHKRHAQLFRALRDIRDRRVRVLLVGFAWANRTADDIRREAAACANDCVQIDILEKVPQAELADHVARCKVFVFLSRKEGDNKALVEAMFADVPVIVYDQSIGGARSRVNASTGVLAADEDLAAKIRFMLDHSKEFSPRAWALQHTGSAVATAQLNDALCRAVGDVGGKYSRPIVEKTNAPNLAYKDATCRAGFKEDYEFIVSCLRAAPSAESMQSCRAPA